MDDFEEKTFSVSDGIKSRSLEYLARSPVANLARISWLYF